tara:strand:+ start:7548 stop:8447 length:900 start_codon:yes stop_codon:yes gene_type:complete
MAVGLIKEKWVHSSKNSPNKTKKSPVRAWWNKQKKKNEEAIKDAQDKYDAQMAGFENQEFTNIYQDVTNPMANLQTNFENTYEDLTVNQQQANFEKQMAQQQQANVLDAMSQGGGFNAGNIQALANQAQQGAARASASIGQQEAANQMAAAQGAAGVQRMEAAAQEKVLGGAAQAQALRLQGEAEKQQFELDKQATLLGMSQQKLGTAQDTEAGRKAGQGRFLSNLLSDRRLKKDIKKISVSPSGIPIYEFSYLGDEKVYSGTMAQDLLALGKEDSVVEENGYYKVNYNNIDVDMRLIK